MASLSGVLMLIAVFLPSLFTRATLSGGKVTLQVAEAAPATHLVATVASTTQNTISFRATLDVSGTLNTGVVHASALALVLPSPKTLELPDDLTIKFDDNLRIQPAQNGLPTLDPMSLLGKRVLSAQPGIAIPFDVESGGGHLVGSITLSTHADGVIGMMVDGTVDIPGRTMVLKERFTFSAKTGLLSEGTVDLMPKSAPKSAGGALPGIHITIQRP